MWYLVISVNTQEPERQVADLSPKRDKLGVALVIEIVQDPHVLAVAEQPVD